MKFGVLLGIAAVAASAAAIPGQSVGGAEKGDGELPPSRLRVRDGDGWVTWWRSERPPARWGDDAPLARRVRWREESNGVAWGELSLAGDGEAWRTRLVVLRLDPRRAHLELDTAFVEQRAAWTTERMSRPGFADVIVAVNAGQFTQASPWGWVVMNGRQYLPAAQGPLSTAVVIDSAGVVHWQHGESVHRLVASGAAFAFQSYPTLVAGGVVPEALREPRRGIDTRHRDARLAIGALDTGELVVALTRFDGLGTSLGALPFGLTSPEMAAVMGALGARDAVMLDGGISAQLLLRDGAGTAHEWRGLRAVPLALIARRR